MKTVKQVCEEHKNFIENRKIEEINYIIKRVADSSALYHYFSNEFSDYSVTYLSDLIDYFDNLKSLGYKIEKQPLDDFQETTISVPVVEKAIKFFGITIKKEKTYNQSKKVWVTKPKTIYKISACCGEENV